MATGALISERYELGDRLGSGGMSSVYKATDRVLERTVAVKVLAEHLSDDEKFVARFRREALPGPSCFRPAAAWAPRRQQRSASRRSPSWSTPTVRGSSTAT